MSGSATAEAGPARPPSADTGRKGGGMIQAGPPEVSLRFTLGGVCRALPAQQRARPALHRTPARPVPPRGSTGRSVDAVGRVGSGVQPACGIRPTPQAPSSSCLPFRRRPHAARPQAKSLLACGGPCLLQPHVKCKAKQDLYFSVGTGARVDRLPPRPHRARTGLDTHTLTDPTTPSQSTSHNRGSLAHYPTTTTY